MRIAYLNTEDLYGKIDSGSLKCSYSNFMMLKEISEGRYLHIFLGDKTKRHEENVIEYKREEDRIKKFLLSLSCRRFVSAKVERKIAKDIIEYKPDVIFYEGPYWGNVIEIVKKSVPDSLFINFLHNIEKNYYANLRKKSHSMNILYHITSYGEKKSLELADRIICLNEREASELFRIYNRKCDFCLPINMYDKYDKEKDNAEYIKDTLLFIGTNFPPNYDGLKWFVSEVMPNLPEYNLVIVGRGFENCKHEFENERVTVIGAVDDLEYYYYNYPALIMPIQYGAGMKVKTAEALMYGKTIFATDEALEGYSAQGVDGVYVCNNSEEFTNSIKEWRASGEKTYVETIRTFFMNYFESNSLKLLLQEKVNSWTNI